MDNLLLNKKTVHIKNMLYVSSLMIFNVNWNTHVLLQMGKMPRVFAGTIV